MEYQVTTFNYGLVVVRKTQQGDLPSTTADLGKKKSATSKGMLPILHSIYSHGR